MKKAAVILASLFCCSTAMAQNITLNKNNIDEILQELSLKEKASLVIGAGYKSMLAGMLGTKVPVPGAAGMTRAIPRLGIPAIVLSDGPAGVRIEPNRKGSNDTFYCTGFPIGSLLSSTWNTELIEKVGEAIGKEALEYGIDVMLAPGMNIHRNPLCGRNFEYFSEDPLLSGKAAAAYVRGIQSQGVGACLKHYAANNQETNRFWNDSRVAEDVLREIYLRNFEIAVKESAPWTIMASYNRLNGVHTQQDKWLLTDVLRAEWGFGGLVMTDWTGKRDTGAQIEAGCDLMEPGASSQINELVRKIKRGELSEESLDICARRVLELIVKTPSFKGYKPSLHPDLEAHASVALEAAEEGIVLLENREGTLPITSKGKVALFGVGSYQTLAGGTGSGHVHRPYIVNLDEGLMNEGFEVEESLSGIYKTYIGKNRPKGSFMSRMLGGPGAPEMPLENETVRAASEAADFAVFTISRQAGEGGDRHLEGDFLLTDTETESLSEVCEAFHKKGKKVVVVLNIGGVIETASWKHLLDAVILAWQPGEEGGNALAHIISGKVNPSGCLPVTFPVCYFDIPSSANFPYDFHGKDSFTSGKEKNADVKNVGYTNYAEGMDVGYRYFNKEDAPEVSYSFGFGLSYTTFQVSRPAISGRKAKVTVTNTGRVPGKKVVTVMNPELVAFGKTALLAPGESQTLTLELMPFSL